MIELRAYQNDAIKSFEENRRKGILDMATGTGKTITSLAAADRHFETTGQQFLVIIVPFLHLIDQWGRDLENFGINYFLSIANAKASWSEKMDKLIWDYNHGFRKRVVLLGSYKSMASLEFQEKLISIHGQRFLIADECHYLGSQQSRHNQFADFECRLGLSATPKRWWDEEGTLAIEQLFNSTVYSFPMEEAIEKKILTAYEYDPIIVDLTEDEAEEYQKLSLKMTQLMSKKVRTSEQDEQLQRLVLRRTKIIQNAQGKLDILLECLRKEDENAHTLVYCGIGQVDQIVQRIANIGVRVHRFNSEVPIHEREAILKQFASGEIEILVAIKCLDEGVDIPSTKKAYFLASTSNPREFIQRRGRILRRSENKNIAYVYDFIVLPQQAENTDKIFKSIATKELPRFAEFSKFSRNQYGSREVLMPYLAEYNLTHLMDILPWDMYHMMQKEGEI
ncbi:DEAD/DEAH box helicase family protein [Carnobacterium maltaromaticum]|uniref:DEAD/DEAH box helicase family protein n=1 Tax=Carnobacterium maltaromaticum TaxID=2751 RepID=UPI0039AFEA8F